MLRCGHSHCITCLLKLGFKKKSDVASIVTSYFLGVRLCTKKTATDAIQSEKLELACPTCRKTAPFGFGFDTSFPKNFAMIGTLQDKPTDAKDAKAFAESKSVLSSVERSIFLKHQVKGNLAKASNRTS